MPDATSLHHCLKKVATIKSFHAEPVKKVRVWSSFFEESEGESDKSDLENTASVSESSIEVNTTIMVSSYEEDSEYFLHKSIITQSMEYITAI